MDYYTAIDHIGNRETVSFPTGDFDGHDWMRVNVGSCNYAMVVYHWIDPVLEERYQATLDDCIPTWYEMVDHWVWYITSTCGLQPYYSTECYDIMHEMLGVQ